MNWLPSNPHNPLNHSLAEGIRTVGFRRWYQRELLSGHAQLVLLLLCTVGFMACLELMSTLTASGRLLNATAALFCAVVGAWALRRYLFLLMRAESIANQANCPACGTYGRLRVLDGARGPNITAPIAANANAPVDNEGVSVSCRHCQASWRIEE